MNTLISKKILKRLRMGKNQKGMALVATLIFTAVLTSFAVALLTMTGNDSKLSTLHRESTRAFYIAEAGIEKTLWLLNTPASQGGNGINWRTESFIFPEGSDEYYDVKVETTTESSPGIPEIISIVSTGIVTGSGEYDKGTRKIQVNLRKGISPSPSTFYNYAIMTTDEDSDLTLNGHITIEGDVHSNGDITGNGFDTEDDLNGDLSYVGDSNLTGTNVTEKETPEQFPSIDWEDYENRAAQVYESNTAVEFNNDVLIGIHYVKGDILIKNSLKVYGTIIAEGEIKVQGNPDIDIQSDDPDNVGIVMAARGAITLGGTVHVSGIIHTESYITLNGNINVEVGAILAEDGVINGTGADVKIVYNPKNQEKPVPGTGIEVWKKDFWREI